MEAFCKFLLNTRIHDYHLITSLMAFTLTFSVFTDRIIQVLQGYGWITTYKNAF